MGSDDEENETRPNADGATNVYRVSLKYAPFNRDDPEIWFTQLEAQFDIGGITVDTTKYGHLIAALDQETVKCVRDQIITPPRNNKYNSLKKIITERLSESAKIKLDRLLSGMQLGDKKPSQLLREMQALSVDQVTETVLKNLWLQRLPTHAQEILSCMDESSLLKIANAADKIVDVQKPANIYKLNASTRGEDRTRPDNLSTQINALAARVEELFELYKESKDKSPRSRSQSRGSTENFRRCSSSRSREQLTKYPNCWYHYKHGARARKCIQPCNFNMPSQPSTHQENH